MSIETTRFDPAVFLTDRESQDELLQDAVASGDAGYIAHALGVIARARNISQLSRDTKLSRQGIYAALSVEGNPSFATILKAATALGYRLSLNPVPNE
jgi:probable addiction module antidote protein